MITQSSISGSQLGFVLVYFVYGLAFFTMGIALALETGRTPLLAERKVIQPLAIFGLMHGIHEWLEIFILQWSWVGISTPGWLRWGRAIWLAASFVPLLVFAIRQIIPNQSRYLIFLTNLGVVLLYLGLVFLENRIDPETVIQRMDALARYLIAIPGAMVAGIALTLRGGQLDQTGRRDLALLFRWSAVGFILYSLTQVFVGRAEMFPANILNADLFRNLTGIPIQAIRATVATLILWSLLRAIRLAEKERESQLAEAQHSRLEAMEQIQRELFAREVLRRELMQHTVITQEDERARIARELHDETAQVLTAFSLNLASLRSSLSKNLPALNKIDQLSELSRQMSQGIYRLVNDLRPAQLDDLGLVAALKHLADLERQRTGLESSVTSTGQRQRLDSLIETVIFRVTQEALANISRHAHIRQAEICLMFSSTEVRVQIHDQGVGFDPSAILVPPHGWGLAGMRERVEAVGGNLRLVSAPGQGTLVEATIPIKELVNTADDLKR